MSPPMPEEFANLSLEERNLLAEVLRALRDLHYGSVVLTVHEGRLVEIQRTQRIRSVSSGK